MAQEDSPERSDSSADRGRPPEPPAGTSEQAGLPDLSRLSGLHERPPAEHIAVYEDISARLQQALGAPDSGTGDTGTGEPGELDPGFDGRGADRPGADEQTATGP